LIVSGFERQSFGRSEAGGLRSFSRLFRGLGYE
jgi:hypothetical protein